MIRGAAVALLAGLEHEDHRPGDLLTVGGQQPGRTHQPGHVQVVPARVHHPSCSLRTGSSDSSVTGNASMSPRSSTAGPGRPPRSTATTDDNAVTRGDLQPQTLQRLEDPRLRLGQPEPQLGDPVQVAAQGDQLRGEREGLGEQRVRGGHGWAPFGAGVDVAAPAAVPTMVSTGYSSE